MKIAADSNIPFAPQACAHLGDAEVVHGRDLSPDVLADCDALLCRSTRRVGPELLDGTPVKFVATATIGTDHVDLEYLRRRGIGFASAPGSNANSVSEYVTSALLVLAERTGRRLADTTIGVVGVGNVGSKVAAKARTLGMAVIENDPPLRRSTGSKRYRPLGELLDADVISLHVPLTKTGPDATFHMVDADFIGRTRPGCVLINSSRGAVVDSARLRRALDADDPPVAVLDVWEGEPDIDAELLERAALATPHIAGHSFDGKVNGTRMVYEALCNFFDVEPDWDPAGVMPPPDIPEIELDAAGKADEDLLREAVTAVYDVRRDDADLRNVPPGRSRAEHFTALRRGYRRRREFHNTAVRVKGGSAGLLDRLAGLGFKV